MPSKIVLLERHFEELNQIVFDQPGLEGAAFLLCGESKSQTTTKLIVHAVLPIAGDDYLKREKYQLAINSRALVRITKLARYEKLSIIFVHSHPDGICEFSPQDDREESKLMPFLQARVPNRVHGTVVLTKESIRGRLYVPERREADALIVIGNRFRCWTPNEPKELSEIYDRQIRAFGPDCQRLLGALTVGVVGVGGTGSAVAEQLYRLGIGELILFDGDRLGRTNINRVYGSAVKDVNEPKVGIAKTHLNSIGLNTKIHDIPAHINFEEVAKSLRDCDVIFGCTDKQLPRAILTKVALVYGIPVFDMGVVIDSSKGRIGGVYGRVTTLLPGEACLFCRGRISPETIRVESLSDEDRSKQAKEGYAPELDNPAPAVISFTSVVASIAVSELLHRLTGFMGVQRQSTEVLIVFDENRIRTNRVHPLDDCMCSDASQWLRGDESPYLGLMWPSRTK